MSGTSVLNLKPSCSSRSSWGAAAEMNDRVAALDVMGHVDAQLVQPPDVLGAADLHAHERGSSLDLRLLRHSELDLDRQLGRVTRSVATLDGDALAGGDPRLCDLARPEGLGGGERLAIAGVEDHEVPVASVGAGAAHVEEAGCGGR